MLANTMSPHVRKLMTPKSRRRGQGMTEYIIIVGLIAIVLVAAVTHFQAALNNAFTKGATTIQNKVTDRF